jgi:hypothetical protein
MRHKQLSSLSAAGVITAIESVPTEGRRSTSESVGGGGQSAGRPGARGVHPGSRHFAPGWDLVGTVDRSAEA